MDADFSQDLAKRALQLEARAHVEVAQEIDSQLSHAADVDIFSEDFRGANKNRTRFIRPF